MRFNASASFARALLVLICASAATAATPATTAPTTQPQRLPSDVNIEKRLGLGNGDLLLMNIRVGDDEDDEPVPFVIDSGNAITVIDKSLAAKLGKRLYDGTMTCWGVKHPCVVYAAPTLSLNDTPLLMTPAPSTPRPILKLRIARAEFELRMPLSSTSVVSVLDIKNVLPNYDKPIKGILGMDCLHHYCVQLDFEAAKMRFLDAGRITDKRGWGKPFALRELPQGFLTCDENLAGTAGSPSMIDTGCSGDGWLTEKLFAKWDAATKSQSPALGGPRATFAGQNYPSIHLRAFDGNPGPNGIGLRFLARHLVTLDFPNRMMYLKRAR